MKKQNIFIIGLILLAVISFIIFILVSGSGNKGNGNKGNGNKGNVETPGDISGVVYTTMDVNGAWKIQLANNMKDAGLNVDLNELCR